MSSILQVNKCSEETEAKFELKSKAEATFPFFSPSTYAKSLFGSFRRCGRGSSREAWEQETPLPGKTQNRRYATTYTYCPVLIHPSPDEPLLPLYSDLALPESVSKIKTQGRNSLELKTNDKASQWQEGQQSKLHTIPELEPTAGAHTASGPGYLVTSPHLSACQD